MNKYILCKSTIFRILVILICIALPGCITKKSSTAKARMLLEQAEIELSYGEHAKALALVEQSLEAHKIVKAQLLQANLYAQLGHWKLSAQLYGKIIEQNKISKTQRADCLNNLALGLFQTGDIQQAHTIWTKLTVDPHYVSKEVAHYNLGLLLFHQSQESPNPHILLPQAIAHLEAAITIAPTYADAYYYAAVCCINNNDVIHARQHLTQLKKICPQHPLADKLLEKITPQQH